jgi:hypothetical protein
MTDPMCDINNYIHLFQPKTICGRNLYVHNDRLCEKINVLRLTQTDTLMM